MSNHLPNADTPCIGICSTIYGDITCRGCMRNYQEVIDWNSYDDPKKMIILQRLEHQIVSIMQDKITITDPQLLQQKLLKHRIAYRPERHPLCWVHSLLRQGADKIRIIEKYGFTSNDKLKKLTPTQLFETIDEALYCFAENKK